jgi:hypothetical protein
MLLSVVGAAWSIAESIGSCFEFSNKYLYSFMNTSDSKATTYFADGCRLGSGRRRKRRGKSKKKEREVLVRE